MFPCVAGVVGYTFVDKLSPYVNAMTNLRLIFAAGCFLFVFFLIWNHMAQSQNETDMVV
jgi:hypothetical protein